VRLQGYTIDQFTNLSAGEAARAIAKLRFKGRDETVAAGLIPEIQQRLRFRGTVGPGYLSLGRLAKTLSGGESQRIRLAAPLRSLRDVESWIEIRGARANNLNNIDARFPVARLSVITGISGSGKSTLMHEVIWPAVRDQINERKRAGDGDFFKLVKGTQEIEAVYEVDQSPIGKTSRSTPGTYVKVF